MAFSDYKIIYKGQEYTEEQINQISNIKPNPNGSYYDQEKTCFICEYVDFDENDFLRMEKQNWQKELDGLLTWFNYYDECQAQYNRKLLLFEHEMLSLDLYNTEKSKIMTLALEAESKAKRITELRGLINGDSSI
jgi:hypothetical protein